MSDTEVDLSPERLASMKAWCETRIAEKPWFKEFPGKPDAVVDCHLLIALIDEINRLRAAETTAREHGRDAAEVASQIIYAHRDGLGKVQAGVAVDLMNAITAAILSERAEAERLRKALEGARDAIAALPEDAFGYNMTGNGEEPGLSYSWPIKDEILHYIDAALPTRALAPEPEKEKTDG